MTEPEPHDLAAELVGSILPRLQIAVAQLGVGPLDEDTWAALETWAELMPLQAGTGQELVVSFSSRLDRLTLRAVGDRSEFGPAVASWLDAMGASDDPEGAERVGGWVEVRQPSGADGGWIASDVSLDRALRMGELSIDAVSAVRLWADGAGVKQAVVVERSVAPQRPSTAVGMVVGGAVEEALAAATGLAAVLRVPSPPDEALGALAQAEGEARVTCRLTATGASGFGVAVAGLPIGVVIDLWRMSGGDHQALGVLQGVLLADDPAWVEWSLASGGPTVLCHYDLSGQR